MKKTLLATSLCMLAFSANAIQGGSSVSWSQQQHRVQMNCTGTLLGGTWILTAAHCSANNGPTQRIYFHDGSSQIAAAQYEHSRYGADLVDIGLWKLNTPVDTDKTGYINLTDLSLGDTVNAHGFGGTGLNLNLATQTVTTDNPAFPYAWFIWLAYIGQGESVGGDSGMAYEDTSGRIRAIHGRDSSQDPLGMEGTHISYAEDFILDTVNGWSYPTNLTVNGQRTIEVQSLHRGGVVDSAYVTGDVSIDFALSTCDNGAISEFQECTYVVNSSGSQGTLHLSANEVVNINKPAPAPTPTPTPTPTPSGGDGGGGGSTGLLTMLALSSLALIRRRKK